MASSRTVGTNEQISTYGASGQGRDYTSLSTWEAATDNDLVSLQQSEVLEVYDDQSSYEDSVDITGETSNSTYFRIIRPAASFHNGDPNAGIEIGEFSGTRFYVMRLRGVSCSVQDLKITAERDHTSGIYAIDLARTGARAVGLILKASNVSWTAVGAYIIGSLVQTVLNSVVYDTQYGIAATGGDFSLFVLWNNTIVDCGVNGIAINTTSSVNVKNNLVTGSGTADFWNYATGSAVFHADADYNASSDGTAPGTNSRQNQTFSFVDEPNDFFQLASDDGGAAGFGTDLSGTFDDDIQRASRSAWDIGAFIQEAAQQFQQALAGALGSSGALLKQTGKPLSGALTSSGVVATVKAVFKLLSGVLSSSGSLTRRTAKRLDGALTSAGAAVKQSEVTLSGTLTGAGDLAAVKAVFKLLTGALSPAGTLTRRTTIRKSGDLSPAGDLNRQTSKTFTGVLTSSGVLQTVKGLIVMLSGALDFSGDVIKQTAVTASGTLTTAGSLVKQAGVGLSGVLTSSGDIEAVRTILKLLTGALTSSGLLSKLPQKHLAGTIPATGRLTRSTAKAFSGALTSSGRVIKRSLVRLTGSLAFSGLLDAIGTILRILGLTLRHRTVELTLQPRKTSLTLRARTTSLTISDRD